MPTVQANRQRVQTIASQSPTGAHTISGTRVVVRPVPRRQPPDNVPVSPPPEKKPASPLAQAAPLRPPPDSPLSARLKQSSLGAKKEPTCSLFMPKHRAHSQLTGRLVPSRTSPTN